MVILQEGPLEMISRKTAVHAKFFISLSDYTMPAEIGYPGIGMVHVSSTYYYMCCGMLRLFLYAGSLASRNPKWLGKATVH